MNDPIVEEVRAFREAIAAKDKFNLHKIAENARRRQAHSGHKIIKANRYSNVGKRNREQGGK